MKSKRNVQTIAEKKKKSSRSALKSVGPQPEFSAQIKHIVNSIELVPGFYSLSLNSRVLVMLGLNGRIPKKLLRTPGRARFRGCSLKPSMRSERIAGLLCSTSLFPNKSLRSTLVGTGALAGD